MYLEGSADIDLIFNLYPVSSVIRFWEEFKPIRDYSMESIGVSYASRKTRNMVYNILRE